MKIGIYTPYLDTVGGGEKYMMTIAEILSAEHEVDVLLDTHLVTLKIAEIIEKITKLHGLNLSKIKAVKAPLGNNSNPIDRLNFLKKYDYLFYLTDGSIFFSSAKNSILHIQSPLKNSSKGLWNKTKQSTWKLVMYNSEFTKDESKNYWNIKGEVVYPPVDVTKIKKTEKKKQILSVGRFFSYLKDKKQGVLIEAFKELTEVKDWSLHLVGGATSEDDFKYVEDLMKQAQGLSVYFYPNLPFRDLIKLYSESSIYWHASGFGETDPTKMEHFGITTVEAMGAGCVPIVINLGGQKEIVENNKSGMLWDDLDQLKKLTQKVIEDDKLKDELSEGAIKRAQDFSKEKFAEKIREIVK